MHNNHSSCIDSLFWIAQSFIWVIRSYQWMIYDSWATTWILSLSRDIWSIFLSGYSLSWWRHQMETFPRYWTFVRGIHQSPATSPHKGQWRGALVLSLICAWTNSWVNDRDTGDLWRHRAYYDVIVIRNYLNDSYEAQIARAVLSFANKEYLALRGNAKQFISLREWQNAASYLWAVGEPLLSDLCIVS